jgi:hypothetical protein
MSMGYVIPEGLNNDGPEVEMNRVDVLTAPPPTSSPKISWRSCSRTLLRLATSSPEGDWAVKPFRLLLELGSRGSCNKYTLFETFECL